MSNSPKMKGTGYQPMMDFEELYNLYDPSGDRVGGRYSLQCLIEDLEMEERGICIASLRITGEYLREEGLGAFDP